MRDFTGAVLVVGLAVFMVGAVRWRIEYERPFPKAAALIHADRRRRRSIHSWMLVATIITPAGLAAFASLPEVGPVAGMAAVVYLVGALCWIMSLSFGLTVVPWAAERTVADGSPPEGFTAFNTWATNLYVVHMAVSYVAFVLLGVAVLQSPALPHWSGWLGIGWGALFLTGFVVTRFAGPFNPPFWAHTYPAVLGVVLLAG